MHGYAHKAQTHERSDIPACVGREGVVPEGLIGRMDRGRQLAARLGRGLVKAMANVALAAGVQFSCIIRYNIDEGVGGLVGVGMKKLGENVGCRTPPLS